MAKKTKKPKAEPKPKTRTKTRIAIGKKLQDLRKLKGLSQEQLAGDIGITLQYLSLIENGRENVSIDIVENLCNELGISLRDLFDI